MRTRSALFVYLMFSASNRRARFEDSHKLTVADWSNENGRGSKRFVSRSLLERQVRCRDDNSTSVTHRIQRLKELKTIHIGQPVGNNKKIVIVRPLPDQTQRLAGRSNRCHFASNISKEPSHKMAKVGIVIRTKDALEKALTEFKLSPQMRHDVDFMRLAFPLLTI